MQILLVADLHYALPQFDWLAAVARDFDAVVIAGDMLESCSHVPLDAQIVVVEAYLDKLRALTQVFVCSGNHDLTATSELGEQVADWLEGQHAPGLAVDGAAEVLGRLLVSVLPWWDGPRTREAIEAQLARDEVCTHDRWLWVNHAPPAENPVSWSGSRFFGDDALPDWIATFRPDYVMSGHVHQAPFVPEGAWVSKLGTAWVFNAGQQPGEVPAHVVLNPEERAALWFSIYGAEQVVLEGDSADPQPLREPPDWFKAAGPTTP